MSMLATTDTDTAKRRTAIDIAHELGRLFARHADVGVAESARDVAFGLAKNKLRHHAWASGRSDLLRRGGPGRCIMRHSWSVGLLIVAGALLADATAARAAVETWVSATGTDTGACPRATPCRTFAYAHSRTNSGGTINVASSGNFGPLTIDKSVSIVADGAEASINSSADGAAIRVQAPVGAVVSLRGLTIDMRGTARSGVVFVSGGALRVQNCQIRRGNYGIDFAPSSSFSELFVSSSTLADNSVDGLVVRPAGSSTGSKITLDRVNAENNNSSGIAFHSGTSRTYAFIRDSIAAGNSFAGIYLRWGGGTANNVRVMVDRTAVVNNGAGTSGYGFYVEGLLASATVGDSTISGNGIGWGEVGDGSIYSYGSNRLNLNVVDGDPDSFFPEK